MLRSLAPQRQLIEEVFPPGCGKPVSAVTKPSSRFDTLVKRPPKFARRGTWRHFHVQRADPMTGAARPIRDHPPPSHPASGDRGARYVPPAFRETLLSDALAGTKRLPTIQPSMFEKGIGDPTLYIAGDVSLLRHRCVAIVGARRVSQIGEERTAQFAEFLAGAGIVVVSGLAAGVDTAALRSAIEFGGRVIAVIGTPLDKASPAANKRLQEQIYRDHLLISQFPIGSQTWPSNFPRRNKLMALISDATVVMEASDSSGTLHQAAECARLRRPLLIDSRVARNPNVTWPRKFLNDKTSRLIDRVEDVESIYENGIS